jgi:hypothetical protein
MLILPFDLSHTQLSAKLPTYHLRDTGKLEIMGSTKFPAQTKFSGLHTVVESSEPTVPSVVLYTCET